MPPSLRPASAFKTLSIYSFTDLESRLKIVVQMPGNQLFRMRGESASRSGAAAQPRRPGPILRRSGFEGQAGRAPRGLRKRAAQRRGYTAKAAGTHSSPKRLRRASRPRSQGAAPARRTAARLHPAPSALNIRLESGRPRPPNKYDEGMSPAEGSIPDL